MKERLGMTSSKIQRSDLDHFFEKNFNLNFEKWDEQDKETPLPKKFFNLCQQNKNK